MEFANTNKMKVKFIDKCKIDEEGNPQILNGMAPYTKTHKFPKLYERAKEENCDIIKRPVAKADGKIICAELKLVHRD